MPLSSMPNAQIDSMKGYTQSIISEFTQLDQKHMLNFLEYSEETDVSHWERKV